MPWYIHICMKSEHVLYYDNMKVTWKNDVNTHYLYQHIKVGVRSLPTEKLFHNK